MTSKIYSTRVPYEGPDDYKIMMVGEAPGAQEIGQGRPFVGEAGELLRRYLARKEAYVPQEEIKFANLSQHRPRDNKFTHLLGTDELEEGLDKLKKEIARARPNVIVALGNWPLYFLTGNCKYDDKRRKKEPGKGIAQYRGSILPSLPEFQETKVIATYHPSYINRFEGWKWSPVFFADLVRASQDRHFPELRYPEYEEWIDPPSDVLHELTQESLRARWTAVDIETFPNGRFSCVGWAFRREGTQKLAGVCITFKRQDLWRFAKEMWEADSPKIFQYATYDIPFMSHFYNWTPGGFYDGRGFDTFVASASLLPDFPRSLDFLCSIHTRIPFYKVERKLWKEEGDMRMLWKYNIKDTVGTLLTAEDQMKNLKQQFGWEG